MTERRFNYLFNDMELQLKREIFTDISTIGTLTIDGKFECYILEDKDRGINNTLTLEQIMRVKVYGKTAIPYGRYEIDWTMSARFKVMMPILLNVVGWSGIRIHKGNTEIDSLGCLLCGTRKLSNRITESTIATNKLYAKIEAAKKQGQRIYITIIR
tara:strand:+ start:166 stop:636 length:471 start_codon:yes stop_codon:yes gene_type:complete